MKKNTIENKKGKIDSLAINDRITIIQLFKLIRRLSIGSIFSIAGFIAGIFSLAVFITNISFSIERTSYVEKINILSQKLNDKEKLLKPQVVQWAPDMGGKPGIFIYPGKKFLSWEKLLSEIKTTILKSSDSIPKICTVRVGPSIKGVDNMLVQIIDSTGQDVGHIWFGKDPLNNFIWDGLIRVGSPRDPRYIWATFQNFSDTILINSKDFVPYKEILY